MSVVPVLEQPNKEVMFNMQWKNIGPNCMFINFELDMEYLRKVCYTLPRKKFYFKGEEIEGYTYAPWPEPTSKDYHIIEHLKGVFGLEGRWNSKFVFLQPGLNLDWHRDKRTKCAINWLVSLDTAPIYFRDKAYKYHSAILDVSKEHRIDILEGERILFKISCFDQEYKEICETFASRYMWSRKNQKK